MRCPTCGAYGSTEDNFCSRCGTARSNSRLPVKRANMAPAPWRGAAPVLARGAALVIAGIAAEWLLRSTAKGALRAPLSLLGDKRPRSKALTPRGKKAPPEGVVAVSETFILRRVIMRR